MDRRWTPGQPCRTMADFGEQGRLYDSFNSSRNNSLEGRIIQKCDSCGENFYPDGIWKCRWCGHKHESPYEMLNRLRKEKGLPPV